MAVTQNTLIGRTRGSIGGVSFSKWKNLNVARAKPISVSNPDTPGQNNQRKKFAFMVSLFRSASLLFSIGFTAFKDRMTEMNALIQQNSSSLFTNSVGAPIAVDPEALIVAKGSMASTDFVKDGSGSSTTIEWPGSMFYTPGQSATDTLAYMVASPTLETIKTISVGVVPRSTSVVALSSAASGDYVYLFFVSEDGSVVSDSVNFEID